MGVGIVCISLSGLDFLRPLAVILSACVSASSAYFHTHQSTDRRCVLSRLSSSPTSYDPSAAGSYDVVKNNILIKNFGLNEKTDRSLLHLLSAMSASVVATTACNPFDVIKSRYMSDGDGVRTGAKKYHSLKHCVTETFRIDGPKVHTVCLVCIT